MAQGGSSGGVRAHGMGPWRARVNRALMPRAVLRSQNPPMDLRLPDWYVAASIAFWTLQLAPLVASLLGLVTGWWRVFLLWNLVYLVLLVSSVALMWAAVVRLRREVRSLSSQGRVSCTGCYYPLDGLEPEGECPECGRPFELEATRDAWRRLRRVLRIREAPEDAGVRTAPAAPPLDAGPTPGP